MRDGDNSFKAMHTDQRLNGQYTVAPFQNEGDAYLQRKRCTGGEEGNSGTSEHANPVLRGKKASQLQSRYGDKQVKHSAASQGRREGKQTALCYLVSALKSQGFPLAGLLWTKLWRDENSGLSWNLISVSWVGVAAATAWMKQLYLSRDTWPLARRFCWDLIYRSWSFVSRPQHAADPDKRDFVGTK